MDHGRYSPSGVVVVERVEPRVHFVVRNAVHFVREGPLTFRSADCRFFESGKQTILCRSVVQRSQRHIRK